MRFEPPLYVPAFTTVKDFHYIHRENYKRSTQDRSTELPPIQPLHRRYLNTKKVTSNKVIKMTTNFSLTTPYRMGMNFGSRSEVRKFSCKESKESLKTTEKT